MNGQKPITQRSSMFLNSSTGLGWEKEFYILAHTSIQYLQPVAVIKIIRTVGKVNFNLPVCLVVIEELS